MSNWLDHIQSDPNAQRIGAQEGLIIDVTELIASHLLAIGWTQGTLASRLGVTEARVSQILNGRANLTLRTVADVFHAMGTRLKVAIQDVAPWITSMEPEEAWSPDAIAA